MRLVIIGQLSTSTHVRGFEGLSVSRETDPLFLVEAWKWSVRGPEPAASWLDDSSKRASITAAQPCQAHLFHVKHCDWEEAFTASSTYIVGARTTLGPNCVPMCRSAEPIEAHTYGPPQIAEGTTRSPSSKEGPFGADEKSFSVWSSDFDHYVGKSIREPDGSHG